MRLGFTGTSKGINTKQFDELVETIKFIMAQTNNTITMCRHGDCIGADATFHDICEDLGLPITIHPPSNPAKRAWKEGELEPELDYIQRNHKIVDNCDILIACSETNEETLRSGTWATVRYARKCAKEIYIIFP